MKNIISIYIFILSICVSHVKGSFDMVFYNVGQGHCCIVKTQHNGIIMVDAGTSSTQGIGLDESNKKIPLTQQLAKNIYGSIKDNLREKDLNFIITHADKDHLNLAQPIIQEIKNNYKDISLRVILGGIKREYNKAEAKSLVNYLELTKIEHTFGDSFTFNRETLLWKPPAGFEFKNTNGEYISFFSTQKSIRSTKERGSAEDNKNAASIVVKIGNSKCSVMITGDKTKKEIANIIGFHEKAYRVDELKADVLLATHHGSKEDFSEIWMKAVKPYCLVVSAGTSSFFHPRPEAVCSEDVLNNLRLLDSPTPWHPVRSYGFLSSLKAIEASSDNERKIIPVSSGGTNNCRNTPYSYCMTNLPIYTTADQGTIKFSFRGKRIAQVLEKKRGCNDVQLALKEFLLSKRFEWNELIIPMDITLSDNIYSLIGSCFFLTSLDFSNFMLNDNDTQNIITIINVLKYLKNINIGKNNFKEPNKHRIIEAWNHRGLQI